MSVYHQVRPDQRRIASVYGFPGVVAENRGRGRGGPVVFGLEQSSAVRLDAEQRKVIARDVLGAQGTRRFRRALPPHAEPAAARLKCSDILELRRRRLQALIESIAEKAPSVLRAVLDAAVVAVA